MEKRPRKKKRNLYNAFFPKLNVFPERRRAHYI